MTLSYTPTTWNHGTAPGIDATQLNGYETIIGQLVTAVNALVPATGGTFSGAITAPSFHGTADNATQLGTVFNANYTTTPYHATLAPVNKPSGHASSTAFSSWDGTNTQTPFSIGTNGFQAPTNVNDDGSMDITNGANITNGPINIARTLGGSTQVMAQFSASDGKNYQILLQTNGKLAVWNATDNVSVIEFGPGAGQITGNGNNLAYLVGGPGHTISTVPSAPGSPLAGDVWIDTSINLG